MSSWEKYGGKARAWSDEQYADARAYLARRAELVQTLGPPLEQDDVVLDLACGDGGLADFLPRQRYVGVDASEEMIKAGRARGRDVRRDDLNEYEPEQPVQATTIFRAIYYARDRRELLRRIAGYTEKKLVFDLNPRQYRLDEVRADLRGAGKGDGLTSPLDEADEFGYLMINRHAGSLANQSRRAKPGMRSWHGERSHRLSRCRRICRRTRA